MLRNFYTLKRNDKGQSLVEFALVLLPLMLIIMGIMEFGWLFNGKITLTSSAREGARVAIVSNDDDLAKDAVIRHVSGSAVTVDVNDIVITPGKHGNLEWVKVNVTGEIEPLVGFFIKNVFTLEAQAEMRKEN